MKPKDLRTTNGLLRSRIVVDIDDTICYRWPLNRQGRPFAASLVVGPMEGAAECLRELHENYGIIYVTARNFLRAATTRRWLRRHGFPCEGVEMHFRPCPFVRASRFKERTIARLRTERGYPLALGLGDSPGDARAYQANGLQTILIGQAEVGDLPVHRVAAWAEVPALVEGLLSHPSQA